MAKKQEEKVDLAESVSYQPQPLEAKQQKSEAPIFESEELEGIRSQDFRSDEGIKLKQQMDEMWQMIHQKGLEVGEPARIMDDINESVTLLSDLSHIISEGKWRKKADERQEEISKSANKGDYGWAYHLRTLQAQEYERGINEILYAVTAIIRVLKKIQERVARIR